MKIEGTIKDLKRLFSNYELDLPGQDSLEILHNAIEIIEKQGEVNKAISSIKKMQDTYRQLYIRRSEDYDQGFADGLEYALMELRGEADD